MKQVERAQVMENQALALALRTFMEAGGFSPILSDSYMVLPGFCDVHVHFREPGYFYKETVHTGCDAAIHGGYTAVCTMPNLNPVPDCKESLQLQLDAIRADGRIAVLPYGAITVGEKGETLADLEGMAENVVAFSDDGRGVQSREMMKEAMLRAKALGKIIVAHCEDNSLLKGGYIHDGVYAKTHGHRGICSESEYLPIARDLELVRETGCAYHVCHVSAKESVELIRKAKAEGLNVTCETAPHYLVLCDEDLQEDGRFKMNPPIRGKEDRDALIAGILDGTVDMIATDHAPHSAEEKGRGLEKSLMGVVGLETAFPVLYTHLVQKGILTAEKLVDLLCTNPRARFSITSDPGFTVFEVKTPYTVDPETFATKGRSTPFAGCELVGNWVLTAVGDKYYTR
ncbi:MAG: dihydroorotase [Clostridia bacterium]|nr:dihydroorotase [Clostridia bacterium]